MRLTELEPRWIGTGPILTGVSFLCPHCREQRLAIHFIESIDPDGWLAKGVTRYRDKNEWRRTGDTFETLTLSPSINTEWAGHWHGFIENGEIKP